MNTEQPCTQNVFYVYYIHYLVLVSSGILNIRYLIRSDMIFPNEVNCPIWEWAVVAATAFNPTLL